jgi:hypothetical protein
MRDQFVADIQRLTDDMFKGSTFAPYLPLFNIWAVWTPSVDAGIGSYGVPRNTVFGLYREGTELRGIYPAYTDVARSLCSTLNEQGGYCDYPSIIGNDDFYGKADARFRLLVVHSDSKVASGENLSFRHEARQVERLSCGTRWVTISPWSARSMTAERRTLGPTLDRPWRPFPGNNGFPSPSPGSNRSLIS